MKKGDPVICKKNDYAGLSRFWLIRIFEKEPDTFLKKGETYYLLGFDDDNIPNSVTMFTKKDFERYLMEPSAAIQQKNVSSINWNNDTKFNLYILQLKNSKSYFSEHFYTGIKEIRKSKLKKLFS